MTWKRLDLRRNADKPPTGALVALFLERKESRPHFRSGHYDIGHFDRDPIDPASRKLWWNGAHGTEDPKKLGERYTIYWTSIDECKLRRKL